MSLKSNVLDLVNKLILDVQALPEDSTPDVAELQKALADAQLALVDAQSKIDAVSASLSAELVKEADLSVHAEKLQSKIDLAIAALKAEEAAEPAPEAPQA